MKNVVKCYKDFFGYFNALKTHSDEKTKPYKCPNCDVIFADNGSLKSHISSAHEKNTPYTCPDCDVIFVEKLV